MPHCRLPNPCSVKSNSETWSFASHKCCFNVCSCSQSVELKKSCCKLGRNYVLETIFTKLKRGSHEIVPSHVPINLSKIPQSSPISLHYLPTKVKQTWCRKAINGMGCCDLWMAREMLPASFRVGHRPLAASLSLSPSGAW